MTDAFELVWHKVSSINRRQHNCANLLTTLIQEALQAPWISVAKDILCDSSCIV